MSGPSRPRQVGDYRYPDRSSSFNPRQLAYIESVHAFLDESDLRKVRAFEVFRPNIHFETVTAVEIPGLRSDPHSAVVYIKRFGTGPYIELANQFLDRVLDGTFAVEVRKFVMRPYRITLPNGDRFYPFTVGVDPAIWRQRFRDAATSLNTLSGEFDRGRFIVSSGQIFAFGVITIEVAEPDDLATW